MSEASWRIGDLALICGYGDERWIVTDAGMGEPRRNMYLQSVEGARSLDGVCEEALARAPIRPDNWVRHFNPDNFRRRKRVVGANAETLHFDMSEEMSGRFERCFSSAATKFWMPVKTPDGLESEDVERAKRLGAENVALRRQEVFHRDLETELRNQITNEISKRNGAQSEVGSLRAQRDQYSKEITVLRIQFADVRIALTTAYRERDEANRALLDLQERIGQKPKIVM